MTNLYRHFNEAGALLYVGISLSSVDQSPWVHEIARIEIEKLETRKAARVYKKQAIAREKPLYNAQSQQAQKQEPVSKNEPIQTEPLQTDRLLTAQEVHARLGLKCQTNHTALNMARRGQLKAVHINSRVVRFTESSLNQLINGARQ